MSETGNVPRVSIFHAVCREADMLRAIRDAAPGFDAPVSDGQWLRIVRTRLADMEVDHITGEVAQTDVLALTADLFEWLGTRVETERMA